MAEHVPFRDFVFNLLADRISELMQLVEEVAFTRLDQRGRSGCWWRIRATSSG